MQEVLNVEETSFVLSDSDILTIEENIELGHEEASETAGANLSTSDCAEPNGKLSDDNGQKVIHTNYGPFS